MRNTFDAVVIGGGPSGATAAILLARAGRSVALIEKSEFPRRKVCGEYVSATSLPLFRELGIEEAFLQRAGPPVRELGLFFGESALVAKMPRAADGAAGWGRALGRESLDTIMLEAARSAGAEVLQPFQVVHVAQNENACLCRVAEKKSRETRELRASIVVAAHGSWESGQLVTQPSHRPARRSDLFGFKAHFAGANLADGLMPLLSFRGGYGGMVHTDGNRVSLSCCIRRDQLELCRAETRGSPAGEAVLAHIQKSCRAVREALSGAQLRGACLSVGPIRPGRRQWHQGRFFFVGNAAGEAHPVIAEGISIAAQSSWLLCERLASSDAADLSPEALQTVGKSYAAAWMNHFGLRLRAAAVFAHWAMTPRCVALSLPVLRLFPSILRSCARISGKTKMTAFQPLPVSV